MNLSKMKARDRLYLVISLSIGILFLILAIVQNQFDVLGEIAEFTEEEIKQFIDVYIHGFPHPW